MLKIGHTQRDAILAVLSGNYTRAEASTFAALCRALALASARRRGMRARMAHPSMVLDEQDLVQECFVHLFRRDGSGRFTVLEKFFRRHCPDAAQAGDAVVLACLRRLIGAILSNAVVSVHAKSDPSLARFLRNLRLALKRSTLLESFDRFGEEHVRPSGPPLRPHLECIPLQTLRARLEHAASQRDGAPLMLRRLHMILLEEDAYQPVVPLVALALTLREVYAADPPGDDSVPPVVPSDVERIAPVVLRRLAADWQRSYVRRGKLTEEELDALVRCVARLLKEAPGEKGVFFAGLAEEMPQLDPALYTAKYRTALEYFVRHARQELVEELRR